jgi:hypothetical protein
MDTKDLRTAINYYHMKIQETNDPYYWHCLADMQARAGMLGEALNTIDNARLMTYPLSFRTRTGEHAGEPSEWFFKTK